MQQYMVHGGSNGRDDLHMILRVAQEEHCMDGVSYAKSHVWIRIALSRVTHEKNNNYYCGKIQELLEEVGLQSNREFHPKTLEQIPNKRLGNINCIALKGSK